MAVSQGNTILGSDIRNWYTSFNNFINTWRGWGGTNIAALGTGPSNGSSAKASDINTLYNKLTEFKNDTYLGTKSSWWVGSQVTQGAIIYPVSFGATGYFASVKCRNTATNAKGCSSTAKAANGCNQTAKAANGCNQTAKSANGCNQTAKSSNGCTSSQKNNCNFSHNMSGNCWVSYSCYNGCQPNTICNNCGQTAKSANGCNPNTAKSSNGCTQTAKSANGCKSYAVNTPYQGKAPYCTSSGSHNNCSSTQKNNCSYSPRNNCSSTTHNPQCTDQGTCGNYDNYYYTGNYPDTAQSSNGCNQSGKGNCSSSNYDNCSSSNYGNCSSSNYGNCAQGTCNNTTVIDITCAQTTKSNG